MRGSSVSLKRGGSGLRTAALRIVIVLVACGVLAECTLRFLLFSHVADRWPVARAFRDPSRFADSRDGEEWFVLNYLWTSAWGHGQGRPPWAPHEDDRLGWTSERFLSGTYAHVAEADLGTRRPVLLLGDSFSACVTPEGTCFESLMDGSRLGGEYALLNYGARGYGLDQTYLLLRSLLGRFASRKPIVLVGLMVDDDLDRCLLDFRDWPKPRLRAENGRLVVPEERIPTPEEYLAGHPPVPASYFAAMLRMSLRKPGTRTFPRAEAEKQELSRLILRAVVAELREKEVPFCFVLFNDSDHSADPGTNGWRQPLVHEELSALAAPYVEVRDELLLMASSGRAELGTLFRGDKHLDERGNVAAFATMLRGLAISGAGIDVPRAAWAFEATSDVQGGGVARYDRGTTRFLREAGGKEGLILRGGREPTTVSFLLSGAVRAFRATAWSTGSSEQSAGIQVSAIVDGAVRWNGMLRSREPQPLDIDLRGAQRLELVVPARPDSAHNACAVFSDPSLY